MLILLALVLLSLCMTVVLMHENAIADEYWLLEQGLRRAVDLTDAGDEPASR